MTPDDHIQTVASCLRAARRMSADGENLLASEMMWGAAIHSVNAVAMLRNWDHGKYSHKSNVVERLSIQYNERDLAEGFWTARHRLHPNFDKGFLTSAQLDNYRQDVQRFVGRMLEIADSLR